MEYKTEDKTENKNGKEWIKLAKVKREKEGIIK